MANERLINKGRNHSISTVSQLGRISVGNASAHPEGLAAHGWTQEQTDKLSADILTLMENEASKVEARTAAKNFTTAENQARLDAKAVIRKLREAVKLITRDAPLEGLTANDFVPQKLLTSTPSILVYLERATPLAARLDTHIQRFFPGQKVSELLKQAAARLAEADTRQETARASLPSDTVAVHELKGRILDQVEELNAIARIAFDGQADIRAKFNKDLLLRGIQHRKDDPETPNDPQTPQ